MIPALKTASLPETTSKSDWLVIGQIVAPQGLDGAVRVFPDSDFPERFLEPGPRWLQKTPQTDPIPVTLVKGRWLTGPGLYVLTFAEYQSRDAAEQLRGSQLVVAADDRPPLEPDEFHLMDLIGLEVFVPPNEIAIGTVVGLVNAGNDLLEVQLNSPPDTTVLVPLVREIVPHIDLAQNRIHVTPPSGLIPTE